MAGRLCLHPELGGAGCGACGQSSCRRERDDRAARDTDDWRERAAGRSVLAKRGLAGLLVSRLAERISRPYGLQAGPSAFRGSKSI